MIQSRPWYLLGAAVLAPLMAVQVALANADRPYAGLDGRRIKSLSEGDIDDLRAGRGMGMALPAELNGYPGPKHVLDLADQLSLTEAQRQRTAALFADMQAETAVLGRQVIEREAAMDRLFADSAADEAALRDLTSTIAVLRGKLRFAHLRYHLAMRGMLTPDQVAIYHELRGYAAQAPGGHGHQPH